MSVGEKHYSLVWYILKLIKSMSTVTQYFARYTGFNPLLRCEAIQHHWMNRLIDLDIVLDANVG